MIDTEKYVKVIASQAEKPSSAPVEVHNQDITITTNGIYRADAGYTGIGTATVTVPVEATLKTKEITANGTYVALLDNADGFSSVDVNVPNSTESITITQNGTYTPTGTNIGFSEVVVNVSGGSEPTGTIAITGNGTFNVSPYATAEVNVPNGVETISITENGTYTPSGSNIGFSSVSVNVVGGDTYLGLPVGSWSFKVDANGELYIDKTGTPNFAGVKTLNNNILSGYFADWTGLVGDAKFDDVETVTDARCFTKMFYNTRITGISFAKLKTISGTAPSVTAGTGPTNGQATFYNAPITSFSMPLLESITTNYVFCNACTAKTSLTSINLGSLTTVSGNYCFYYAFSQANITTLDLSNLTTISGSNCFNNAFAGSDVETVDLSSLTSISGDSACANMFAHTSSSTSKLYAINMSNLTTINGNNACANMFSHNARLESNPFSTVTSVTGNTVFNGSLWEIPFTELHFDSIQTISGSRVLAGFIGISAAHPDLTDLTFDGLTTATGTNVLSGIISGGLSSINTLRFKSLETITGEYGCAKLNEYGASSYTAVNKSYLKHLYFDSLSTADGYRLFNEIAQPYNSSWYLDDLWFYALNSSSFGSTYINQFYNMLSGHTGTTVHFPIALQSTIGSWSDVVAGFGGTNITVLFDIVTSLTGADTNTYTRYQKESGTTYTAWKYNDTVYYTSGTTEPAVSDTIYSDSSCTVAVTTIDAIA